MNLINRQFAGESDFSAMRNMLIDGYLLEQKPCNMFYYYLDNWRFSNLDEPETFFQENATLWEKDGKLIAFNIFNNLSQYILQVHPKYHGEIPRILELLLSKNIHKIALYEYQKEIITHVESFGYKNPSHIANEYEYDLSMKTENVILPNGFIIKTASEIKDFTTIYKAKGTVFKGPHMTEEACAFRMESKQKALSYSNDSVFLVLNSDMECVSFAMAWLDTKTQVVGFEPIGTVPEYQRKGLSKALLKKVFSKYRAEGFKKVSIKTRSDYEAPANYLYRSLKPLNIYSIVEFSIE